MWSILFVPTALLLRVWAWVQSASAFHMIQAAWVIEAFSIVDGWGAHFRMKTIAILTLCTSPGTFVPIVHQFTAERGMGSWTSFAWYPISNWAFPDGNSCLNSPMALKWCTKLHVVLERCPIVFWGHLSNLQVTGAEKLIMWIQF